MRTEKVTLYKIHTPLLWQSVGLAVVCGVAVAFFGRDWLFGFSCGCVTFFLNTWWESASIFVPVEITLTITDDPAESAVEVVPDDPPPKPTVRQQVLDAAKQKAADWAVDQVKKHLRRKT